MSQPLPIDHAADWAPECPTCGGRATIIDRFTLAGSPGPVEHIKISCVAGHWFTLPADWFSPSGEEPRAGEAGRHGPARARRGTARSRDKEARGARARGALSTARDEH